MNRVYGNKRAIILFTLPALLVFTVIVFYPILQTIGKSFTVWDGLTPAVFNGIDNYKRLFTDPLFHQSMTNGFIFAGVLVVVQVGFAAFLALMLANRRIKWKRFFRTAFFLPVVLSVTVVCQLWAAIYNPEFGLINKVFEALGMSYRQDWLSGMNTAIFAIIFVNVWQCYGYQFAILYAGVRSIPEDYIEAAQLDGASPWKLNFHIIIPLLKNTFRMCFVLALTGGLNAYAHINLLTRGGPGTSTYTLTYMTFRSAFSINEYGYGCASSVILVLQCVFATLLINFLFREKE